MKIFCKWGQQTVKINKINDNGNDQEFPLLEMGALR